MKIIVGIGNPGKKYARTRHNIGFMVVDRLAERHGLGPWRRRFHAMAIEGRLGGGKVLLMKPETYVNETGRALSEAVAWCRTAPEDIMVVCDDLNLPSGRLRVRGGGSSGGHNGLKSVLDSLGAEDVPRLRIGIGAERQSADKDFVLSSFTADERPAVADAIDRAAGALEEWLERGVESCQNIYNQTPKKDLEEDSA